MSKKETKENQAYWDSRVAEHMKSDFYAHEAFMKGSTSLDAIALRYLGDIHGLDVLHVQCHFGQDTLSMARLGAQVTGVDFSEAAIRAADQTARELALEADFIQTDIYDMPTELEGGFDVVFASYGVIGWHRDVGLWTDRVVRCLRPGGRFILIEFHPVVWMWDDHFSKVTYSYFNGAPIEEQVSQSYAGADGDERFDIVTWNHSLGEVFEAMRSQGLHLERFEEYDYSPYPCFEDTVAVPDGYQIRTMAGQLPMVYSMAWHKPVR